MSGAHRGRRRETIMLRLAAPLAALALMLACSPGSPETPEQPQAPESATIEVRTPQPGARVTSPLRVEGAAPGDWFFEAIFPAELQTPDGQTIAQAPAEAQSDWMTEAPVPFVAVLEFEVSEDTPATLLLREDMPSGLPGQREISIPVVLVPR